MIWFGVIFETLIRFDDICLCQWSFVMVQIHNTCHSKESGSNGKAPCKCCSTPSAGKSRCDLGGVMVLLLLWARLGHHFLMYGIDLSCTVGIIATVALLSLLSLNHGRRWMEHRSDDDSSPQPAEVGRQLSHSKGKIHQRHVVAGQPTSSSRACGWMSSGVALALTAFIRWPGLGSMFRLSRSVSFCKFARLLLVQVFRQLSTSRMMIACWRPVFPRFPSSYIHSIIDPKEREIRFLWYIISNISVYILCRMDSENLQWFSRHLERAVAMRGLSLSESFESESCIRLMVYLYQLNHNQS